MNNKYFTAKRDFVEPIGRQLIKKNSIFLYLENFDSDYYEVVYYDPDEESVYPLTVPRKNLERINPNNIDKDLKKRFEDKKAKIKKGIYLDDEPLLKTPEERAKAMADSIKRFGLDVEGRPEGISIENYLLQIHKFNNKNNF